MLISLLKETKTVGARCYKFFRTFEFDVYERSLSLFVWRGSQA